MSDDSITMTFRSYPAAGVAMIKILDDRGRPTEAGGRLLSTLASDIESVLHGHEDNTGATCRIDLGGHDCCYTCNRVEAAMIATIEGT